ncbi:GIP [Symbiodinium sp. KB8]|nr:GIP [Symbiodinium sp. KB8]
MADEKSFLQKVSWDGAPEGWPDFVRRVRLIFERTKRSRRHLLAPEIVTNLTGRAWNITQDLDHAALVRRNGTIYLLEFLRDRLGKNPVPDVGLRLEELVIRLKRPPGMAMATWSSNVRQVYRRVQIALARARKDKKVSAESPAEDSKPRGHRNPAEATPTPPKSTSSSPTRAKEPAEASAPEPSEDDEIFPEDLGEDLDPGIRGDRGWRRRRKDSDSDDSTKALEDLRLWESYKEAVEDVLPSELLGWLLLRRAGLTTQSRLAVQAAAGNSLRFEDIERCLRNMEEELSTHDDSRRGHGNRGARTLWVEEDGHWSMCLMAEPDVDELLENQEVLYLGTQLPHEVYATQAAPDNSGSWSDPENGFWSTEEDGSCIWWQDFGDGDYFHEDASGVFWSWNHSHKDDLGDLPPEQQREIEDAFSAAEAKVRSFTQARQAVKAKSLSRGFYPFNPSMKGRKGKGKGFGKSKGKGKGSSFVPRPPPPVLYHQGEAFAVGPGDPGFTGCFICNVLYHGTAFMIESENAPAPLNVESDRAAVLLQTSSDPENAGFGIIDCGATETAGAPKASASKAKPKKTSPVERDLDWARAERADPRDPRTLGPPCNGLHQEALPGRGSPSGANGHAMWKACRVCGLRILYVPRIGAHGLSRKAGPLSADTAQAVKELPPEQLQDKRIGNRAAEQSALRRLEQVRRLRQSLPEPSVTEPAVVVEGDLDGYPDNPKPALEYQDLRTLSNDDRKHEPGPPAKSAAPMPKGAAPSSGAVDLTDEQMPPHPGRKSRREVPAAEELEFLNRDMPNGQGVVEACWMGHDDKMQIEAQAKDACHRAVFTFSMLEKILMLTFECAKGKSRSTVHKSEGKICNHLYGFYVFGGFSGITNRTQEFPEEVRIFFYAAAPLKEVSCGWKVNRWKVILSLAVELRTEKSFVAKSFLLVSVGSTLILELFTPPSLGKVFGSVCQPFVYESLGMCPEMKVMETSEIGRYDEESHVFNLEPAQRRLLHVIELCATPEGTFENVMKKHQVLTCNVNAQGDWMTHNLTGGDLKLILYVNLGMMYVTRTKNHKVICKHDAFFEGDPVLTVDASEILQDLDLKELARGADPKLLAVASQLKCEECYEGQFKYLQPVVNLEKEDTLWATVQIDAFSMKIAKAVCHFILYVDEASGYAVVDEIMRHPADSNENISTSQFLKSLHMRWIQYFGIPTVIKLDLEGAFRGIQLRDWCGTRGVRLEHAPAEFHQSIGDVERQIGFLRHKIEVFLRHEPHDPSIVAASMVGEDVAIGTMNTSGTDLHSSMMLRKRAEQAFREQREKDLASRALNARTRSNEIFTPGDLIYYRRLKEPADQAANSIVDKSRMRIGRFYGPGRVLASETKVEPDGRKASHMIWIISQGRLKKCHSSQLRHATEQERLISKAFEQQSMPWTLSALTRLLDKGEYDDETIPSPSEQKRGRSRTPGRAASRGRLPMNEDPEPPVPGHLLHPDVLPPEDESEPELIPVPPPTTSRSRSPVPPTQDYEEPPVPAQSLVVEDWLHDVNYLPPFSGSQWTARPRKGNRGMRRGLQQTALDKEEANQSVFSVVIDAPDSEEGWKRLVKDPRKFVSKSIQKGVEVNWQKLSPEQQRAMSEAKALEVDQWIAAQACEAVRHVIPDSQLLRMRWVLTFKSAGSDTANAGKMKAKARIVILGFSDPHLLEVETASPAMSRLSRQLFLQMCSTRRWRALKADVKSAFLQAESPQRDRQVYARPIAELAAAMNLKPQDRDKKIVVGIITSHVDDFLLGGEEDDDFSFSLNHSEFCEDLKQIPVPREERPMSESEMSQVRAVLGSIQWRVYQSGPQHASKLGYLQSLCATRDSSVIPAVNKLVREVHSSKHISVGIQQLGPCDPSELSLVCWSDAALANRPDLGSTGGYVVAFMTQASIDRGNGRLNLASWRSSKLSRVARSSLAAETQALSDAEQELMFTRLQWRELQGDTINLSKSFESTRKTAGYLVIDAKAVYDTLMKGQIASAGYSLRDKYSALELQALSQHIQEQETTLLWCDSDHQLADGMTKSQKQDCIKKLLLSGVWRLRFDDAFISAKKRRSMQTSGE